MMISKYFKMLFCATAMLCFSSNIFAENGLSLSVPIEIQNPQPDWHHYTMDCYVSSGKTLGKMQNMIGNDKSYEVSQKAINYNLKSARKDTQWDITKTQFVNADEDQSKISGVLNTTHKKLILEELNKANVKHIDAYLCHLIIFNNNNEQVFVESERDYIRYPNSEFTQSSNGNTVGIATKTKGFVISP